MTERWNSIRLRICGGFERLCLPAAVLSVACLGAPHWSSARPEPVPGGNPGPHLATERTGTIESREGQTLHLTTDLGSVRIVDAERGARSVQYRVHIETDARGAFGRRLLDAYSLSAKATSRGVEISGNLPGQNAKGGNAQFWVQYEVVVPVSYNVEVRTAAGDITAQDIGGTADLVTEGGNIYAGRLGVNGEENGWSSHRAAHLETQGGHIQVQDVTGDLVAFTAGGHIRVGNISGDASLHSGGGHITAGKVGGRVDLETDGGNITVAQAGSLVTVRTGGGQIDFGEVRGSVRAQTGGGGIRVMTVSGPMQVESTSGSICLTKVAGTVQASTGDGTITAWINPDTENARGTVHLAGASQLASGNGDVIVFLPRNLAANIEAVVASGDPHHIEFDPSLKLSVQSGQGVSGAVHATGVLNGGGPPLRLRTANGVIRLKFLDADSELRASLVRDQEARMQRQGVWATPVADALPAPVAPEAEGTASDKSDWLEMWISKLEVALTGGLREDPTDFRKRLTYSPPPAYPQIAQRAGVQGVVRLQVRVLKNKTIEVQKVLEGEPSLADAAVAAVKRWRANPAWINGEPVEVISVVTFNFQLH
ncbi:MAG TPA: TonB family protein [Candidatus Acidoferrum sp.]|nr:TonB family protein [Candidatus Acidoferrum sp.]